MFRFSFGILSIAAFSACGDDSTPPRPDIVSDVSEVTDLMGDLRDDDAESDVAIPNDVNTGDVVLPGRTVAGTALEGVVIAWPDAMTLCNVWVEGAPLEDEKARKVIVDMPAQTRTTLDEGVLGAGSLHGLVVRTSPFAVGLHRPAVVATRVEEWRLRETEQGDSLFVSIAHELEGKAGTIHEEYNVFREPGAPTPVAVSPESYDMTLAWTPWGRPEATVRLERCGGHPALEDAVSVAYATDGNDWVAVLRYWRTSAGEVAAGSYPVHLIGHHVILSDSPWWPTAVGDFWAQTYVAKHHNFDDDTELDLMRDIGHWHIAFRNRPPQSEPIARVRFEDLSGFDTAAIVVEKDGDSGIRTRRYAMVDGRRFPRVDAAALSRVYSDVCDGGPPEVLVSGYGDHRAQLLICGGARRSVVGLVPVVWASDMELTGQRFEVTRTESNGWGFQVGTRSVTVFFRPDDNIEMLIEDAAGELVSQAYDVATTLAWPTPRIDPVIAAGTVGNVAVRLEIERLWVGLGVGKSQVYVPASATVTFGDDLWHITAWDRLTYTNTHHNWEDSLVAEAEDGTEIIWSTSFFGQRPNVLTITGPGGEVILPETVFPKYD